MNKKPVHIPNSTPIEDIPTADLIRGLYVGFRFTYYEMEATKELARRDEVEALMEAYRKTPRKFARVSIERALKLPKGGAK